MEKLKTNAFLNGERSLITTMDFVKKLKVWITVLLIVCPIGIGVASQYSNWYLVIIFSIINIISAITLIDPFDILATSGELNSILELMYNYNSPPSNDKICISLFIPFPLTKIHKGYIFSACHSWKGGFEESAPDLELKKGMVNSLAKSLILNPDEEKLEQLYPKGNRNRAYWCIAFKRTQQCKQAAFVLCFSSEEEQIFSYKKWIDSVSLIAPLLLKRTMKGA